MLSWKALSREWQTTSSKAQLAFAAARLEQAKTVQAQPDYGPAWCVLGVIDAALGRKEEALREGRRAVELLPVEKDSVNGFHMIEHLAVIAAWVGEKDLACEQLAKAIRYPMYPSDVSYGELKLSPWWDALRGEPCFEKIVNSLAPKGAPANRAVASAGGRISRAEGETLISRIVTNHRIFALIRVG